MVTDMRSAECPYCQGTLKKGLIISYERGFHHLEVAVRVATYKKWSQFGHNRV